MNGKPPCFGPLAGKHGGVFFEYGGKEDSRRGFTAKTGPIESGGGEKSPGFLRISTFFIPSVLKYGRICDIIIMYCFVRAAGALRGAAGHVFRAVNRRTL